MSTILKALKKLEDEKRAAATLPLSGKILVEPAGERRKSRGMMLLVAGAAGGGLFAALLLAGVFWLQGAPPFSAELSRGAVPQSPARKAAVEHGAPSQTAPDNAVPAATVAIVVGSALSPVARPASPVAATPPTPAPQKTPLSTATAAESGGPPVSASAPLGQVNLAGSQIPPPGEAWSASHLLVTDIFPGTGDGARMAVINGLPVMEGTRVEGFLVKEIRAGEVLFEGNGSNIVVPLRRGD